MPEIQHIVYARKALREFSWLHLIRVCRPVTPGGAGSGVWRLLCQHRIDDDKNCQPSAGFFMPEIQHIVYARKALREFSWLSPIRIGFIRACWLVTLHNFVNSYPRALNLASASLTSLD